MSSITPIVLAVSNASLLRWIDANPGSDAGWKAIGEALGGRDGSNLRRSVEALREAGYVAADTLVLTDAGRALLPGLDALEGRATAAGQPTTWPHDRLRLNPLNPRKTIDADALAGLAETIAHRGIIEPVVAFPADEDGVRTLRAGERRWRAVQLLVEAGRLPADWPVPFVEAAAEPGQAEAESVLDALVENGQRENLSPIQEARAYADLVVRTGWSAAEAARRTGKHPRLVQEALQIIRKATPDALAAHERGELTWEALRESVRDLDLTPKLALVVAELADKVAKDHLVLPASWDPGIGDRRWAELAFEPIGGAAATLQERGLVQIIVRGDAAWGRVRREEPRVERWLQDNGFDEDRAAMLQRMRLAVVSESAARLAADEGFYVTDFLRTTPEPEQTDLEEFTEPAAAHERGGGLAALIAPPAASPADIAAGEALIDRMRPPPEPEGPVLKPRAALALIELARACQTRPLNIDGAPQGRTTQVHQEWLSQEFADLVHAKLAKTTVLPGKPRAASLTDAGVAELIRRGWALPNDAPGGFHYAPGSLNLARGAAGLQLLFDDDHPSFASAFLHIENTKPPAAAPHPTEDAEPDEPHPDQALLDRARALVGNGLDTDHARAMFAGLLFDCVGDGPISVLGDGCIVNAVEETIAVVDPERDLSEPAAQALALLVASALNAAAGLANPFATEAAEAQQEVA